LKTKPTFSPKAAAIHDLIEAHLATRRALRIKEAEGKKPADIKKATDEANEKYSLQSILKEGMSAAQSIAIATHIAKGIHPDLKVGGVTNLHVRPDALPAREEIGSHLLSADESLADATGNSKHNTRAYELYLLLDLKFEGQSLFQLLEKGDKDAISAFEIMPSGESEKDRSECQAQVNRILGLMAPKVKGPASGTRGKQLYWLTGGSAIDDLSYELLIPLYPSALAHFVYSMIERDLFSVGNKEAREAKKSNKPHDVAVQDYSELAVYRMGGGHPKNISDLVRQRKNRNYLLASLPPKTNPCRRRLTLNKSEQLWSEFLYWDAGPTLGKVSGLIRELAKAMEPSQKGGMQFKQRREDLMQLLGNQLIRFSEFVEEQTISGWTRAADCDLDINEKLWLDSRRVALPNREDTEAHFQDDLGFVEAYHSGEWADKVAGRFASFVNTQLRKLGLETVGDEEYFALAREAVIEVAWPQPMRRKAPKEVQL